MPGHAITTKRTHVIKVTTRPAIETVFHGFSTLKSTPYGGDAKAWKSNSARGPATMAKNEMVRSWHRLSIRKPSQTRVRQPRQSAQFKIKLTRPNAAKT